MRGKQGPRQMFHWKAVFGPALLASALLPCTGALSAPTIQGLNTVFEGDSVVYNETNNPNVIWVAPPTSGTLALLKQSAAFVSKPSCEMAASTLRRRVRMTQTIEKMEGDLQDALLKASSAEASGGGGQVEKIKNNLEYLYNTINSIKYDPEMMESGGFYSYVASSGLAKTMDAVRKKNIGKTVEPIHTTVTSIIPSLSKEGEGRAQRPSDIFLKIGIPEKGQLAALADRLQVDVEVTKLGACMLAFPDVMSTSSSPFRFGFIVNYEYPFLFLGQVSAEYNLTKVYERIEESGTKNGLFKSTSYSDVIESSELRSALAVKVVSDTALGPEEQLKLERHARELVLNVAVGQMVARFGEAAAPARTGAAIASEELAKACGVNVYCQGTAVGLKILDGIFGGSEQRSRFKSTLNHTIKYESSTGQTLPVARTISYVAE